MHNDRMIYGYAFLRCPPFGVFNLGHPRREGVIPAMNAASSGGLLS